MVSLNLTRDRLVERVPRWLLDGKSIADMALLLGCTKSTLIVKCSQYKISLRRSFYVNGGHVEPYKFFTVMLLESQFKRLVDKAEEHGQTPEKLVYNIMTRVIEDDLYKAVLDEDQDTS